MNRLWDQGAQNERTRLAWQRTLLSMAVCSLVVARLTATRAPVAGLCIALATVALGAVLATRARHRYRAAESALRSSSLLPDGRDNLVMVLLLLTIGLGAATMLLTWG